MYSLDIRKYINCLKTTDDKASNHLSYETYPFKVIATYFLNFNHLYKYLNIVYKF